MLREDIQNRLGSLIKLGGGLGLAQEADATTVMRQGRVIPELLHCWSEQ
jgi:hypothetical protein